MSKEQKECLFKLFNTDDKFGMNIKHIGFGLCTSKMIVEQFEGSMDVCTQPNMGSTFTFSFKNYPNVEKSE
jgi:K+-sensing histidine kinase KdpD